MADDPGFIFYPGDYLRDTQCLSENSQVAYDRIMCEHMRNICISKERLKFFTKKLSESEREDLLSVLVSEDGNYKIKWVAESILKRRAYSDSRRSNRKGSTKEHMSNISKSYDKHMDNENENEIVNDNKTVNINESAKFVELVNSLTGKKFKATSKINLAWKARVKEGYSLEDVTKAIKNAMADSFHVENQFKHLTAEFFTRSDKLEKWINTEPKPQNKTIVPNSMTHALKIGDDYYNKRMAEIAEQERLSGNDQ